MRWFWYRRVHFFPGSSHQTRYFFISDNETFCCVVDQKAVLSLIPLTWSFCNPCDILNAMLKMHTDMKWCLESLDYVEMLHLGCLAARFLFEFTTIRPPLACLCLCEHNRFLDRSLCSCCDGNIIAFTLYIIITKQHPPPPPPSSSLVCVCFECSSAWVKMWRWWSKCTL